MQAAATLSVVLRGVTAVIVGYLLLVLLSTAVQEWWLQGVSYRYSSLTTLILAGVFTPMAGAVAGFISASIARRRLVVHALPICLAITIETAMLYHTGRVDGPLWFEAMAGATLIGGVALGFLAWRRMASEF